MKLHHKARYIPEAGIDSFMAPPEQRLTFLAPVLSTPVPSLIPSAALLSASPMVPSAPLHFQ